MVKECEGREGKGKNGDVRGSAYGVLLITCSSSPPAESCSDSAWSNVIFKAAGTSGEYCGLSALLAEA